MNYFAAGLTVAEIKKKYRELAMYYHPDRGGDTATMQEINAQYLNALKAASGQTSKDNGKEYRYTYNEETEKEVMDKINEVIKVLPRNLTIMLIGIWIWVSGTTYADRIVIANLKKLGFHWHSERKVWYWKPSTAKKPFHNGNYQGFGVLKQKYGYEMFAGVKDEQQTIGG